MAKTANGVLARAVTIAGGRAGALIILFLLVVAFTIVTPDFLTVNNLVNILRQYSVLMILAVGQTLVIVSRGIDLSVASNAALSGSVMGVAYAYWAWPEPASLLAGLAAGVAVGAFNGFVITRLDVPDFIATLGTFVAVRGIALLVTDGLPVPDFERAVEDVDLHDLGAARRGGRLYANGQTGERECPHGRGPGAAVYRRRGHRWHKPLRRRGQDERYRNRGAHHRRPLQRPVDRRRR